MTRHTIDVTDYVPWLELLDETTDWTIATEVEAGETLADYRLTVDPDDVQRVKSALGEVVSRLEKMECEEPERYEKLMSIIEEETCRTN